MAINVYNVTSIDYYRAVMMDNSDLILLSCSDSSPYERLMSTETGMLSEIRFFIAGQRISVACSVKEYAMGVQLLEVYLPEAKRTIYVGRSGQRVRLTGKTTTLVQPTLTGLVIFSVTKCEKIG